VAEVVEVVEVVEDHLELVNIKKNNSLSGIKSLIRFNLFLGLWLILMGEYVFAPFGVGDLVSEGSCEARFECQGNNMMSCTNFIYSGSPVQVYAVWTTGDGTPGSGDCSRQVPDADMIWSWYDVYTETWIELWRWYAGGYYSYVYSWMNLYITGDMSIKFRVEYGSYTREFTLSKSKLFVGDYPEAYGSCDRLLQCNGITGADCTSFTVDDSYVQVRALYRVGTCIAPPYSSFDWQYEQSPDTWVSASGDSWSSGNTYDGFVYGWKQLDTNGNYRVSYGGYTKTFTVFKPMSTTTTSTSTTTTISTTTITTTTTTSTSTTIPSTNNCPADADTLAEFRHILRKALINYFTNPSPAKMLKVEDLLEFYLAGAGDWANADCSDIGANSGYAIATIVNDVDMNIDDSIVPTCSDGTEYGECSATKPLYCYAGTLISKPSICN
jgi:hypothetical protein